MTKDSARKREIRARQAATGEAYNAARRAIDHQERAEPPRLYPIVGTPCPVGCDGSGHPGSLCRLWRPEDCEAARWQVRRAAALPNGRAEWVARRDEEPKSPASWRSLADHWLLALVYAMLSDHSPELCPDPAGLRSAVETDDLDAVDAIMEPLDRAAARLLTKQPERWWGEVKPMLDAYVTAVEGDTRELWTWQEIEDRHRVGRLADKWRKAWEQHRNASGYLEATGVMWVAPKGWLDALLVRRHGGHSHGTHVSLADGRPAVVYAVEWGEEGPPVAYRVRELEPGKYGNTGRLVPILSSDELVAASNCRPLPDMGNAARRAIDSEPAASLAGLTPSGRPWVSSWDGDLHHDVNPACGHHLRTLCGGCGVCTTCDGCYCAELADEAALDARIERETREHLEHDQHRTDCERCERERRESADYTRCPACGLAYPDGIGDHHTHNPPYCSRLPVYRLGIDWGYLRGQHVTLVGSSYTISGHVLADQDAPDPRNYYPNMRMRRTDPGYEDGPGETSSFNPREWLEVHPAPASPGPTTEKP